MSEPIPTTCMRCAVGCGHLQHGADRGYGLAGISGDPAHPTNGGLACGRGLRETAEPDGEWLTRPLVRKEGELVPTSWDTALGIATDRLAAARARDPDRVAVLGSGQQTNEAAYLLGKLARGALGTRNYDANTTLCMASAVTAYYDAFGSDAPPPTYDDIPEADVHLLWGANPAVAHPVLFRWLRNTESELIVVDPVESESADHADVHVAPEPGTDLALARAVLARLIETDRIDRAFVAEHTEGFEDLAAGLATTREAAANAGVSLDSIETLAAAFEKRTLVYWGMGVNQSTQGTATTGALIDCCLASGNLGEGSGPFSLTGQANSMGTRVCSAKGTWPGHRDFSDPDHRGAVAEAWTVPVERLPADPGPGPVGIGQAMADGDVEVCYTVATNPVAGLPDAARAREAFEDTFLVAQDAFETETTRLADVVLPAATWGESEGTTTNMERTVSRVRAATDLPSGVRSDLDVIGAIGRELAPRSFERPPLDPERVFEELAALTRGTPADLSGISYARLEAELAVRWPAPDATSDGGYRYRTDEGWRFETISGKARFSTGTRGKVPEPTDEEYPLTLTTARKADEYNTGVRTRNGSPEPPVARLHPDTLRDAAERVRDGLLDVRSRRGTVTARVEADDRIPLGMVWLPIHHPAVNELTLPETDPRSDEPNYKQCAVGLLAPTESPERPAVARGD
ncbi:assimilatory nitrate reductase NasA [Halalkalicoccus jeotgali]|uniref:Molybdopterin oxidoreductase n=1 Tax=Halalkalicoccus jeotgali (strain DSM 18796 / CECT 7217 / JCM 14584 / KCTC 4019 / B3) TaxID=795797 RepID=D8J565_HALJB|nr:assimilatory nitrate reductase NasA [Halalkalicoccus jeotgali]ADJ13646.1 molybdopterin oxidoreductase [Halalkalicoccus jeotgali B3]ELY33332.1 molybdopterin oxidoreductase [Halalkalicoccus jeotgali B3]